LAAYVFLRGRQSFVSRVFAIGMVVLAIEAVLTGFSLRVRSPSELIHFQRLRAIIEGSVPGIWLIFSLSFGRANYREFLARWKWVILAFFALPLIPVTLFWEEVYVGSPIFGETSMLLFFRVGWAGYAFRLFYLIGSVLILMNLERTLRYSIGHSRWQVKFMILGVGSIFGARIYTDSQVILFSFQYYASRLIYNTYYHYFFVKSHFFRRFRVIFPEYYAFFHLLFSYLFRDNKA
jgi:hypothetical protein